MDSPQLTQGSAFKDLVSHFQKDIAPSHLRELLADDTRNSALLFQDQGLALDLTHSRISPQTVQKLLAVAAERGLAEKIKAMLSGQVINMTEGRSVLHTALRAHADDEQIKVDGEPIGPMVQEVLGRVKLFSEEVRSGKRVGYSGKPLTQIVTIGIGGSYLGVDFVYEALKSHPKCKGDRVLKLIANVDPLDAAQKFASLDHEQVLFIVLSKTFTTAETMLNARTAKNWLLEKYAATSPALDAKAIVAAQICAVSTALDKTAAFGIESQNVFGFWNWVGGRFSVCSAIGALPLSLVFGFDIFQQFLDGARAMDRHFASAPLAHNFPVLMGLLAVYNAQVLNHSAVAVLPYAQALRCFAQHIQQLSMESNGKRVAMDGTALSHESGPIIFGEPGTNGQHSFYQLLHQGRTVPAEFIGFTKSQTPLSVADHDLPNHDELMANFFAQPDALAIGKTDAEVKEERKGVSNEMVPHFVFLGNRPSLSLLFNGELNAYACGRLLALYEHRVAVEGFMYGINSFDQMGVELGKVLAKKVRGPLAAAAKGQAMDTSGFNPATARLLAIYGAASGKGGL